MAQEITERLTRIACPRCGREDHIQFEEATIYVRPITKTDDGQPCIDEGREEMYWSHELEGDARSRFTDGSMRRLVCFGEGAGHHCHTWDVPGWVVDELFR